MRPLTHRERTTALRLCGLLLLGLLVPRVSWSAPRGDAGGDRRGRFARLSVRPAPTPIVEAVATLSGHIDRLRDAVAAKLTRAGRIRRVLYPAGGADVAIPFAMFDGAAGGVRELVVVDVTPFGNPSEVHAMSQRQDRKTAYFRGVRDASRDGAYIEISPFLHQVGLNGPAILWELEAMGATDLKLDYLHATGRPRAQPRAPIAPAAASAAAPGFDMWSQLGQIPNYDRTDPDVVRVTFKLGGTRRSVLYVQHSVMDPTLPQVLGKFIGDGIDAYLDKAAMGLQQKPAYQRFAKRALQHLDRRHGVVVSDSSATPSLAVESNGLQIDHVPIVFGYHQLEIAAPAREPQPQPQR